MEGQLTRRLYHPWLWGALACTLALVLSVLALLYHRGGDSGRILEGVTVEQVPVGGMTCQGALAYLERSLLPRYREGRVLLCQGGALVAELTWADLGAQADLAGAVEAAYAVGRDGGQGLWARLGRGWRSLFGTAAVDIRPAVQVDGEQLEAALPPAAQNAWYDKDSGQVVEGRIGVRVERETLEKLLSQAAPGASVHVPVEVLQPEITAEELQQVLFRDCLGTYTTTVSGSSVRKNNVRLSAAAIDGTVLCSGEVFDYNAVVGERTVERGYGAAPAYVNGETVSSVGGGICQTSSTLYMAALLSNLEIVERHAHGYVSGYITMGMDATVSWGGPEFRFKNDTAYPIRLEAAMAGSELTVSIYGTKLDGSYVEMTYQVLDKRDYQTRYQETDALAEGEQSQKQSGYTGYTVQTYRNVYDAEGNLLVSREEARSVYKSRDRIILVGTRQEAPEDTGQASADGENGGGAPADDGGSPGDAGGSQTAGATDDPLPLRKVEDFL